MHDPLRRPWTEPGRDPGLTAAAQRGDLAALFTLLREYRRELWSVCFALTLDRARAERLFHDTLLKAVDELYTDRTISDGTWQRLASRFNEQQLLDILITTGGYHMVSMALNSFGVQLEPGGEGLPTVR